MPRFPFQSEIIFENIYDVFGNVSGHFRHISECLRHVHELNRSTFGHRKHIRIAFVKTLNHFLSVRKRSYNIRKRFLCSQWIRYYERKLS